ncbi:MAG TPA: aminotransferase class III-fold pyridoxal phosphate-dependent enzyme, partial [Gemmatimonas sp.]|uniref:aminotransferase class III-fold pyridoxal phosphate-dependent enzyme n=1 Tax=Gemmatimonas sp. TaxID=1962908 RepID=UPI002ED99E98
MTRSIAFGGLPDDGWRSRAADVIPGGSSTGSKRPEALYGTRAFDAAMPTHFERAQGCAVWSTDGRRFIDLGMALGAVGIGYADLSITQAVQEAVVQGNVATLPHRLEVEVAERLTEVIPCAEQVRFLRTGAEATAAAVRLARTATDRQRIIACGYFGWLDWCSDAAGVPPDVREAVTWVPFDDVLALRSAVKLGPAPAAIIIEPLVHDIASLEWLQAAREEATRSGAVLIFDEVKTAFRVRTGGVQSLRDVTPDLTTLGKAMANGYPLAAVVGRADVMDAARRTWISSTAATESTGLAAARAVLEWHDRLDVCDRMAAAGGQLQQIVGTALAEAPWVGVQVAGPPVMWRLVADVAEQLDALVAAAARAGVLLKRGAYQFGAVAHDDAA